MTPRRIPDLLLEQLHAGELSPEAAADLRARLDDDAWARLAALVADDARTLADYPPRVVAAQVRARASNGPSPRRARRWAPALGVAAAAALWLAVLARPSALLPGPVPPGTPEAESVGRQAGGVSSDVVRAKGDPRLLVYRRTADGAEALSTGAAAAAGDELRIGFLLDAPMDGVLVSLDGRGVVTQHWPPAGAPVASPAGRTLLDEAYALDDAPDFERFLLVTGPGVSPAAVATAAARLARRPDAATAPLDLRPGWRQTDFLVHKKPGPAGQP